MSDQRLHIYLNPVAADRAEDFERFLTDIVEPAAHDKRPDLEGRFRWMRAATPEAGDAGVVTYVFLFEGGDLQTDWNLDLILPAVYGTEESDRLQQEWASTFVPIERWLTALREQPEDAIQVGWTFTPSRRSVTG